MAGHNKWSKVKHKKAAADAQKSKEFSRLTKAIKTEARAAGGDTSAPGLRAVVEKARAANMPKENIERAIASAHGGGANEDVAYEAYGPGGTAIIMEGATDNTNRTSSEIKHLLSQNNLSLATPGSTSWAFERAEDGSWKAKTTIPLSDEEKKSLSALVEKLEDHPDIDGVYTNAE